MIFLIFENVTKTSTTTFSSVAAVSGKLELSFNNNVTVTGSLDKEDFTVTDSGTAVSISSVTISNGKILIASSYSLGSTTPYDLSSSSSSLSGHIHILQDGMLAIHHQKLLILILILIIVGFSE